VSEQDVVSIVMVLAFVLIGGVFAGTELALVSLRESQLDQLARSGRRGAIVARVARNPNRFLAAVQIGVTVAGFFSAAFGAATLAPSVAPALEGLGVPASASGTTATVLLTLVIAFLSLVLGELVPKRLALQRSTGIAVIVTPVLDKFAILMTPVIWLLSVCTDAIVRVLGGDPTVRGEDMTPEELRDLVSGHEGLDEEERRIVRDVLSAGERTLAEVMRPRGDVSFVKHDATAAEARDLVSGLSYSRYPVMGENSDDVRGFLHVRDLLKAEDAVLVSSLMRDIEHVPATARVMPVLSEMRAARQQIVVVVDEYGGTDGIATFEDLLEELVGEISDEYDAPAEQHHQRGEVDAGLTIEEFAERTGVPLPDGPYETVGGYVMAVLERVPEEGDVVTVEVPGAFDEELGEHAEPGTVTLTVSQMEGMRVRCVVLAEQRARG